MVLLVTLLAVAAAVVVGVATVAGDGDSATSAGTPEPREGRPPLSFALGFRTDGEARALARGSELYADGDVAEAGELFGRHHSLEARVGAAFVMWPDGTFDRLEQLAKLYPENAMVQLHLGLARLWANRGDPLEAWRAAAEAEPDTPYAVLAGNLLYPKLPRGLPAFLPSFAAPRAVTSLPPERQLAALEARASHGGVRDVLLYGVGLQRVGRPVSARGQFERAARMAPNDVEAQVAGAVGRFDKARPAEAFGRLGPLTNRFPDAPTVRFHLGVLLLWTGRIDEAKRQLRLASRTKPGSPLAREAKRYLETIQHAGS